VKELEAPMSLGRYQSRERTNFSETIISVLDKSIAARSEDSLLLKYHPKCYTQAFKAMTSEHGPLGDIAKESDLFVYGLITKRVFYADADSPEKEMSEPERYGHAASIVGCLASHLKFSYAMDQSIQLQDFINYFMNMQSLKQVFTDTSKESFPLKEITLELLSLFIGRLPEQAILVATDRLLNDNILEGIFQFILQPEQVTYSTVHSAAVLMSKVIFNNSIHQYLYETDVVKFLFEKMLCKDVFYRTIITNSKSLHTDMITAALLELSNYSDQLSEHIEECVLGTIHAILGVQNDLNLLIKEYMVGNKLPGLVDERNHFFIWYDGLTNDNFIEAVYVWENFVKLMIPFYVKFLELDSSTLSQKLLERGLLTEILAMISSVNVRHQDSVKQRLEVYDEVMGKISENTRQVAISNIFAKTAATMLVKAMRDLMNLSSLMYEWDFSTVVQLVHFEEIGKFKEITEFRGLHFDYASKFSAVTILLQLIDLELKRPFEEVPKEPLKLSEEDFLNLIDYYVNIFYKKQAKDLSIVIAEKLRTRIQERKSNPDSLSHHSLEVDPTYREGVATLLPSVVGKIAQSMCQSNMKLLSLYMTKVAELFPNEVDNIENLEDLILNIFPNTVFIGLTALLNPSLTLIVSFYETKILGKIEKQCLAISKFLWGAMKGIQKKDREGYLSVNEVLAIGIAPSSLMTLTNMTSKFYAIYHLDLGQEKFYRNGVEQDKALGCKKARFARLRIFESLRTMIVEQLQYNLKDHLVNLQSEKTTQVKSKHDMTGTIKDAFKKLLLAMIDVAIREAIEDNMKVEKGASKAHVSKEMLNQLLEFGFSEPMIRLAASRVKNPKNADEICEWILSHPDLEPVDKKMDEERVFETVETEKSGMLEATAKEYPDFKMEMVDQYKKFCLTLLKYFIFVPNKVELSGLLSTYTLHASAENTGGSRQFVSELYFLFFDYLNQLKSQIAKVKCEQDMLNFEVVMPEKITKTKKVETGLILGSLFASVH
jgi:hypothetical protein